MVLSHVAAAGKQNRRVCKKHDTAGLFIGVQTSWKCYPNDARSWIGRGETLPANEAPPISPYAAE